MAGDQTAAKNADQAWQFAVQAALLQHTNAAVMTQCKDALRAYMSRDKHPGHSCQLHL